MASRVGLALAVLFAAPAHAVQQSFGANGQPAPQAIDEVVMQVFDKDHDSSVSLKEVTMTLDSFAAMGGMMGGGPEAKAAGPSEIEQLINAAKKIAPALFELLDANSNGGLSAQELKSVARVQKALKSGAMRNLTRDVFAAVDADSDDMLSQDELSAAADPEGHAAAAAVPRTRVRPRTGASAPAPRCPSRAALPPTGWLRPLTGRRECTTRRAYAARAVPSDVCSHTQLPCCGRPPPAAMFSAGSSSSCMPSFRCARTRRSCAPCW